MWRKEYTGKKSIRRFNIYNWNDVRTIFWSVVVLLLFFHIGNGQEYRYKYSAVLALQPQVDSTLFRSGLDLIVDDKYMPLAGRKLAVIANDGSRSRTDRLIFDIFQNDIPGECLAFIQVDESAAPAQTAGFIYTNSDSNTAVKFFILNGSNYRIDEKMIGNAELIVVDLPNSGLRESLALGVLIEALKYSAEHQIPVMILDRPNPLGALETGGPVSVKSRFTDGLPLPARYGLTIGELALMINEENWLDCKRPAVLTVVRMANYLRDMRWKATGLKWYYPDKSVLNEETAVLYAGLYFLRFSNVSLGAGTIQPYQFFGAPWISGKELVNVLAGEKLSGVDIYPVTFKPHNDGAAKERLQYADTECSGISLRINDFGLFDPYKFGTILISAVSGLYPQHFKWTFPEEVDRYAGDADFRSWVDIGADLRPMLATWIAGVTTFQKDRLRYCLYPVQKK